MAARAGVSGEGWRAWSGVILASVALHGLVLGGALLWSRELPPPRRVVTVAAVCLTAGSGHAGGGAAGPAAVQPQAAPAPQPPPPKPKPKPKPVKAKPRPPRVKHPPVPRVQEPPPPDLALPRPAAPVRPAPVVARPAPASAAAAGPGTIRGQGRGQGSGRGAGRGLGPGSGTGTGFGPGSHPGPGQGAGDALKSYLAQVRRLLEQQKAYPWTARRQHRQGVVLLKFTIGRGGEIAGHGIARSSGHEVLDAAAAAALKQVGRFPPLPPALGRARLSIQVPLAFRLNDY